jgi:alkaline phosphatase
MKRQLVRIVLVVLVVTAAVGGAVPSSHAAEKVKNVIMMVPDGCSSSVVTAARWYKGAPLNVDKHARGFMQTYMANSVITGSAAAATAFATGKKTTVRFLSVGPRPEDVLSTLPAPPEDVWYAPYATVLEGAKLMGKATGLISTSRITHATPAAYAAHIQDRGWDNDIMEHLVYNNVDVAFGGGKRHLLTTEAGGKRTDGEDLLQVLLDRGYQWVETRDQLSSLSSGKAWGMFASSHMAADIDRAEFAPDEPSLAEMTSKAIELLSQDPDGFFLMVEGSQVDWAGHANDPIHMITDFLAFDEAFGAALDFARADGDTLILAFPDHNTGGMAIGSYFQGYNNVGMYYTETTVEGLINPLLGMKISAYGVSQKIYEMGDATVANIKQGISDWWGLEITDEDAQAIIDGMENFDGSLDYAISRVISERYTVFGWTTHGHSAEDVPLWSYGPWKLVGTVDNTKLAKRAAKAMGINLDAIEEVLFQNVADHFESFTIDDSDPENLVLRVGNCSMPVSKDMLNADGMGSFQMPGLTVHAPATDKCYVSIPAIAMIEAFNSQGATKAAADHALNEGLARVAERLQLDPATVEGLLTN